MQKRKLAKEAVYNRDSAHRTLRFEASFVPVGTLRLKEEDEEEATKNHERERFFFPGSSLDSNMDAYHDSSKDSS